MKDLHPRDLYYRRIVPAWLGFANGVGGFIEELIFRLVLAFNVLAGRMPIKAERRWWNRAIETPVLVDVYDWTDERLIYSVLVWPSLESPPEDAPYDHRERVGEVLETIARGSADKAWSVRWEIDGDLRWDADRQVWVGGDGYAYDGARLTGYSWSVSGGVGG
jgi:hypothetical protein